jgi:hypothetical protein
MAIDATRPLFREITAVNGVPQFSLTRRDRELQTEEGHPPMEVASTEGEALQWRRKEDLQERWKRRRVRRASRRNELLNETQQGTADAFEAALADPPEEREESGTLFDDRS